MESLRIGFTSDYFHPFNVGGAERSALELAKALVRRGHEVLVYTRFTKGLKEESEIEGIRVKRAFKTLSRYTVKNDIIDQKKVDSAERKTLYSLAKNDRLDILHAQNRDVASFTALAGKDADVPVAVHIRDYWPICPKRDLLSPEGICPGPGDCVNCMAVFYGSRIKKIFYKRSLRDTEYRRKTLFEAGAFFIHISDFSRKILKMEPSVRIYNPVDISLFRNSGEKDGKVLYIGGLARHKGVKILADAVNGTGLELHLIGDGPEKRALEGRAVLHGKLEYARMLELLSDAEMLVVPSLWNEPFGRVVVEGMAAGKPVIVSRRGALPEIGGDAVLSVEPSAASLRHAVEMLHNDSGLRKELGKKGVERSRMFSPVKIAEEQESLYKMLLHRSSV